MVASPDLHASGFVDLFVGAPGDVVAGRNSLASPSTGLADGGRNLRPSSILLVGTAVTALLFHSAVVAARQRLALWFSFWSFTAAVGFLGFFVHHLRFP